MMTHQPDSANTSPCSKQQQQKKKILNNEQQQQQQTIKTRRTRRKKRNSNIIINENESSVTLDRRIKRPRNSPPNETVSEKLHRTKLKSSSSPSEFIKFLPVQSLIKYLNHHYLLNSPLQSNSTSSSPTSSKKIQLVDDYHQFSLLVSSNLNQLNSNIHPDPHDRSTHHKPSIVQEHDLLSPSTSITPSSSKFQLKFEASSTSSSLPYYQKLFSSSSDSVVVDLDPHNHLDHVQNEQSTSTHPPKHSLFKFDQTLFKLVLNHHHQTFPTLIIQPTHDSNPSNKTSSVRPKIHHPYSTPESPSTSPSSSVLNYVDRIHHDTRAENKQEEAYQKNHENLQPMALQYPPSEKLKTNTSQKAHCMTLDQHGFFFKIRIDEPPSDHPSDDSDPNLKELVPPDQRLQLIENHVLSHFVYSIKTRGNALRPK